MFGRVFSLVGRYFYHVYILKQFEMLRTIIYVHVYILYVDFPIIYKMLKYVANHNSHVYIKQ